MAYMVAFTINIPQMLAYISYMDPMGMLSMFLFELKGAHPFTVRLSREQRSAGRVAGTGATWERCLSEPTRRVWL